MSDAAAMRAYRRIAREYDAALSALAASDDPLRAARGIARGCIVGLALWVIAGLMTCAYLR
jgi:hypothetical protein